MSDIQLHVLRGTPDRVEDSEKVLVAGMIGQGYTTNTLMRLSAPDTLEYISGLSVGTDGEDWQPNLAPGDICVVLSFKK